MIDLDELERLARASDGNDTLASLALAGAVSRLCARVRELEAQASVSALDLDAERGEYVLLQERVEGLEANVASLEAAHAQLRAVERAADALTTKAEPGDVPESLWPAFSDLCDALAERAGGTATHAEICEDLTAAGVDVKAFVERSRKTMLDAIAKHRAKGADRE